MIAHPTALLPVVCATVRAAGDAVLRWYDHPGTIRYKQPFDAPVTAADVASQEIIAARLAPMGYPILSEEHVDDPTRCAHERVWIVDPLDGTKEFIQQTGEFCIMVGLAVRGRPELGVIYLPTERTLYAAVRGGGAFVQRGRAAPVPLAMRPCPDARAAVMLVSRNHAHDAERLVAEHCRVRQSIPCGSAGVKACRVASGDADLYLNRSGGTGEWDTCAPECIVREAGGAMTDCMGRDLVYNKVQPVNPRGFAIAHPSLHPRVLEALATIPAAAGG